MDTTAEWQYIHIFHILCPHLICCIPISIKIYTFKRGAEIPCRFLKVSNVGEHSFPAAINVITATSEAGLVNCVLTYASFLRSERRRYKTRKITKV